MMNALTDAFWDSLAALPWLLATYVVFEFLESRYEGLLKKVVAGSHKMGPLVGALLGCLPQCGFSMVASALYCHRNISLGTLIAVYLSTSDEAIPVILAQPHKIGVLAPLLLCKIIVAMLAGFTIDLLGARFSKRSSLHIHAESCACVTEAHCCGHKHDESRSFWRGLLFTPALHTLQIFGFIFAVSLALNLIVEHVGEAALSTVLLGNSLLQPFFAVVLGLIPNCAASVVITQAFLKGGISFGSTVAGLCASAGLGLIVLIKELPTLKEALKVIGLLASISFVAGVLINYIM